MERPPSQRSKVQSDQTGHLISSFGTYLFTHANTTNINTFTHVRPHQCCQSGWWCFSTTLWIKISLKTSTLKSRAISEEHYSSFIFPLMQEHSFLCLGAIWSQNGEWFCTYSFRMSWYRRQKWSAPETQFLKPWQSLITHLSWGAVWIKPWN